MKKIYFAPELEVIKIQTPCMLAGSVGIKDGDTLGDEFTNTDESFAPGFSDNIQIDFFE